MARRPFFSGNYGSALGSTANAANIIARAGEQQGQRLANMGAQIGGMIQQYGLNKEKRNKAEAAFQGTIGRMSQTPEGAERLLMMQNDPVIGKDLKAIQEGQGKMKNFDNVNAYLAGEKEQDMQIMAKENAMLKLENARMQARVNKELEDATIRKGKAEARKAEQESNYLQENDRLQRELLEGEIDFIKIQNTQQLLDIFGLNEAPFDIEKKFSEIKKKIDEIDDSQVKAINEDGVEEFVSFKDYLSNPDRFRTSNQIEALKAKKAGFLEEQHTMTMGAKIPVVDDETGEIIQTTVREFLEQKQNLKKRQEDQKKADAKERVAKLPGAFQNIPSVPIMNY